MYGEDEAFEDGRPMKGDGGGCIPLGLPIGLRTEQNLNYKVHYPVQMYIVNIYHLAWYPLPVMHSGGGKSGGRPLLSVMNAKFARKQ